MRIIRPLTREALELERRYWHAKRQVLLDAALAKLAEMREQDRLRPRAMWRARRRET